MDGNCAICGESPTNSNPLRHLVELRSRPADDMREIVLCADCTRRREVRSWSTVGPRGQVLETALESHPDSSAKRFSYLEDEQRIHLLRLRPDWVGNRAADAS